MHFNVITIARTLGAGGEDLGTKLADELGFRYVDAEIIDRAAALAQITPDEMARVEARKGLMARILENLARAGGGSMAAGGIPEPTLLEPTPNYERMIVDVVHETADMGFVVIVAHGAAVALAGKEGVLRILVTASKDARVERVAAGGQSKGQAAKSVEDSDKSRADYFKRFYQLDHELPTHYDVVVNTDVLDVDHAAAAILALARM